MKKFKKMKKWKRKKKKKNKDKKKKVLLNSKSYKKLNTKG